MILIFILFLLAGWGLGVLPLTDLTVRLLTGLDLRQVGTGNVSVSAAFTHGGRGAGTVAVIGEMLRGMVPVIAAQQLFPDHPAAQLLGLMTLVMGRAGYGRGGGITNVTWGLLLYSPRVTISVGISGVLLWQIAVKVCPQHPDQARREGGSLGCLTGGFWVWFWHRWPAPQPLSMVELLAAVGLSALIVYINLLQSDDIAMFRAQRLVSLQQQLQATIHGNKATRLAELLQAGFSVTRGWVIPAISLSGISDQMFSQLLQSLTADFPVIVRSSAVGEDSDSNSGAGQYLSIAPVHNAEALRDAIDRCLQSYSSPGAIAYRQQRQLPDQGMAVLIQPYVAGEISGVLFTRHPLDGRPLMVIEALPGHADRVVTGQYTPVQITVDLTPTDLPPDQRLKWPGGVRTEQIPLSLITQLVQQGQAIEAFFHGIPQDIEWTWDGKTLWILQSRPITNLRPIWTRTIAAEVIPGTIHPLTWSINRPLTCGVWGEIFILVLGKQAEGLDFTETATLLGSHAYFNATLLGEIFRMMGLPEQGLEFLIRGQKMGKPPLKTLFKSLPGLGRLLKRELSLIKDFQRDEVEIFRPALAELASQDITTLDPAGLITQIDKILNWLKPITYYQILGPISLAIRRSLFQVPESWLPTDSYAEIQSMTALKTLAAQVPASVSAANLDEYFQTHLTLKQAFDQWLSDYGYLSEVGTDIAVKTWREQPDKFHNLLLNLRQTKPELSDERIGKDYPKSQWEKWRFKQCQERAIIKGKIAEIYSHLLAQLRWHFLALEQQWLTHQYLEQSGDIFYLELSEIKDWIRTGKSESLLTKIQGRRETLARDQQTSVPTVIYGNVFPETRTITPPIRSDASILQGIPASAGTVEGVIKICHTANTSLEHPDTILVVPYTDAGWAPLLLQAKGIIAEVGGQLSHGAIIAREYRIPAIMNVTQAMTLLQDGERVRIDGYQGTVKRVPG